MNQSTFNSPANTRIAYIEAGWHSDIVANPRHGFLEELQTSGLSGNAIDLVSVPGSPEIPLQCQRLARGGCYQAIVACGLIVDGGIYRHDFVASTVLDAMMQVQLATKVPVLSVVLTPHHFSGAAVHQEFFSALFRVKGQEAAQACIRTLALMASVSPSDSIKAAWLVVRATTVSPGLHPESGRMVGARRKACGSRSGPRRSAGVTVSLVQLSPTACGRVAPPAEGCRKIRGSTC